MTSDTKLPVKENVSINWYNKITKPCRQSFSYLNNLFCFNTKSNFLVTKRAYFTTLEAYFTTLETKFTTLEAKFTTLEAKFTTKLTLLINNLNYDENNGFYFCNNLKYNSYKQNNSIIYINK